LQVNVFFLCLFGIFIAVCSFVIANYGFNNDVMGLKQGFIGIGVFGIICVIDSAILVFAMKNPKHTYHYFLFTFGVLTVLVTGLIFIIAGSVIMSRGEIYVDKMRTTNCTYNKPELSFD